MDVIGARMLALCVIAVCGGLGPLQAKEPATTTKASAVPREVRERLTKLDDEATAALEQGDFAKELAARRQLQAIYAEHYDPNDHHARLLQCLQNSASQAVALSAAQQDELRKAHRDDTLIREIQLPGELAAAATQLTTVIATYKALLGEQDSYYLQAQWASAALKLNQGKSDGVDVVIREVAAGYEKLLGEDHPEVANLYGQLVCRYHAGLSHWDEAEAALRRAEKIRSRYDLAEDYGWCDLQIVACEILLARGKHAEAERTAERVIAVSSTNKRLLPCELRAYLVLGQCREHNGRHQAAIEAFEHAFGQQRKLGLLHITHFSLHSLRSFATAYRKLRRAEEAELVEHEAARLSGLLADA